MKVQTRITLLLGLLVATFLAGLLAFRTYGRSKFEQITRERFAERNRSFDEFLRRNGEPLQTLVEDTTCFDQMVEAIASDNYQWCNENLSSSTLSGYHANAVWVYRSNGSIFYSLNNFNAPNLNDAPFGPDDLPRIFAHEALRHFFVMLPQGLMEIRGGTIHPSKDFRRETAGSGYLLAGRLWNRPTLDEMSAFTGNTIDVVPVTDRSGDGENDARSGLISFSRVLSSWDEKPLARLVVRSSSPIVKELNRESERLLLALGGFALLLLFLISISLERWVRQPLRTIVQSLRHNDPALLESLHRDNSEFGQLAGTVQTSFEQRDSLIREIEERRAAEEALRKSEEQLRHSQKLEAVGRLAGGVAHDFNNLLTAIIGYADLVANGPNGDRIVRQHGEMIRQAGEQAASLTRQLLAFSRKQILHPKVIDLNKLVVEMEKLLRRVIGERFELKTLPHAEDGRVKADPGQLEQVILNLGVNARDAMPNGGKLVIQTRNVHIDGEPVSHLSNPLRSGNYVVLSVADSGNGMDEQTKSRIFEPFFTTKGPGQGTGLGLATVYGVVRQSGGAIAVDSEPGRGTTFSIFLPHETAAVDYFKPSTTTIERNGDSGTVLVAEDEDMVRQFICDVLTEQGYKVLSAMDGSDALEIARHFEDRIDLLITDVIMPQMNGQELADAISAFRPDTKVLFVSGYSDNELGDDGMINSRIELLQKPFTPEALARKIRRTIANGDGSDSDTLQMQLSI